MAAELALDPARSETGLPKSGFASERAARAASKLDAFKADIARMLEAYPWSASQSCSASASRLCRRYSIVKDYVRAVRPEEALRI